MTIEKRQLASALTLFQKYDANFDGEPEEGYEWKGTFLNTLIRLSDKSVLQEDTSQSPLNALMIVFLYIKEDISNIATIALRLEWSKDLWIRKELTYRKGLWPLYAATDVDLFHVEVRSIFDYVAKAINLSSNNPRQTPESFRGLREWIARSEGNVKRLGNDLAEVVSSCDWFDDLRMARDSIVHRGGTTLIVPDAARIFFRISLRPGLVKLKRETIYDSDVADFESYVGLYLG